MCALYALANDRPGGGYILLYTSKSPQPMNALDGAAARYHNNPAPPPRPPGLACISLYNANNIVASKQVPTFFCTSLCIAGIVTHRQGTVSHVYFCTTSKYACSVTRNRGSCIYMFKDNVVVPRHARVVIVSRSVYYLYGQAVTY